MCQTRSNLVATRFLALLLLLLLPACAPSTGSDGPRVQVEQFSDEISFYPRETGATWYYLPANAPLDERRLIQRSEGPTVLNGEVVTGWRLVGGSTGIDEVSYRRYGNNGVFLLRTVRPGGYVDFDPPLQEFPPATQLQVGATWEGETVATTMFPEAPPDLREETFNIRYRYIVVDQRPVAVPAGEFDVFVINFQSESLDSEGNVLEARDYTSWFAPFVGDVRNRYDQYLLETNFPIGELAVESTGN